MSVKNIPLHQLKSRANAGIDIQKFKPNESERDINALGAHRDDHYIFFLMESGTAALMLDFNKLHFEGRMLCYILPGQVHHYLDSGILGGWYLAVDTALVPANCRDVFEGQLLTQQPISLDQQAFDETDKLLQLLHAKFNESNDNAFYLPITYALLHAFIGTVAIRYSNQNSAGAKTPRSVALARQFKALLAANIVTHKSPSAYADLLNVTEGYLNDVLKKATGFSVSQLITNEVVLEAKRLLFYSQLNVKEIAHALGYQDHTYFSRLFKKTAGTTPLGFRAHYLK